MDAVYTPLTVINVASNAIIGLSIILFIISVFGNPEHSVWENKARAYLCKIGLGICGCGALMNVLTFSTPPLTEVILNVGLAMNLTWLALWQHDETQKCKQKKVAAKLTKPKPKKRPKRKAKTSTSPTNNV